MTADGTSVKVVVPAVTSREHLMSYAKRVLEHQLKLPHARILEVSISDSKYEKDDELTYRIRYVNELN